MNNCGRPWRRSQNEPFKRGQQVEVNMIWGGAGVGKEPYRAWFKGYRYVCLSPDFFGNRCAIVVGRIAGLPVPIRFPLGEIRALA